jgi:hypothetical protein
MFETKKLCLPIPTNKPGRLNEKRFYPGFMLDKEARALSDTTVD